MDQITGALVSIALVISAVFLPMAFFGGSTGVIYRQFSITIISAMLLSVLVAIVFTPALCATLLTPNSNIEGKRTGFFGMFNRAFNATNHQYRNGVSHILGRTWRYLAVYGLIVAALVVLFKRIPPGFLPDEDQGVLYVNVSLPPGSTLEQTNTILDQVRGHFLDDEKDTVESALTVSGFNFSGHGQSQGLAFIRLKDWDVRPGEQNSVKAVAARATAKFSQIRQAMIFAFYPPAVRELGNASGFDFELLDQAGVGHDRLMAARNQLLGACAKDPALFAVRPNGLNDEAQYQVKADREIAKSMGLDLTSVDNTLATAWGSSYVNNFIDRGRVKRVFIQGRIEDRMLPEDFNKWYVRNLSGQMVPFSAFARGHWMTGSPKLERYNGLPSMEILGQPAPGQSTGIAMNHMEQLAKNLPPGVGFDWTGLSYEERLSGGQGASLYAISLIVVFLALAALYESWSIPVAVMLVVPLGVIGAALAAYSRGLTNDVFFQVGLLTTVGLSAKNAILIVEFAKANFDGGMPLIESTVQAAHQRLRPILMTSLAFIFGVLPLAISHGAGSGGQNDIGTGVIGGMLSATVLAIFFVPLFFVVMLRLFRVKPRSLREQTQPTAKPEMTPGA
jgi:multidrug efflux pump